MYFVFLCCFLHLRFSLSSSRNFKTYFVQLWKYHNTNTVWCVCVCVCVYMEINWRRQWHPTPVLLPGKIPWKEEPGGLQSMGSLRVGHDWATSLSLFTFHFHALEKEMATHSSVLAWRIPGMREPGGLPSMGLHRVRHDWSDLAVAAAMEIN